MNQACKEWHNMGPEMARALGMDGFRPICCVGMRAAGVNVLEGKMAIANINRMCRTCLKAALTELVDQWFDEHPGPRPCDHSQMP